MTTPPRLVRLDPSHALAYRALMIEASERHPEAFTSSVADRLALAPARWAQRLSADPQAVEIVVGAFAGATLLGAAGLTFETREKVRHKATLFGVYVIAAQRGAGVARLLVADALRRARERPGVARLVLTVTAGNHAAERLYAGFGFETFGVEPDAIRLGAGAFAKVHMGLDLARALPGDDARTAE